MEKLPNFFIVGAPKAGTTTLYEYLNKIPGIYMSPVKEPKYFSSRISKKIFLLKPITNKNEYLKLFENVKNEKIIGEASPGYLADPDAPKLIYKVSPNAKILISLRDPIERLFSNYLMQLRNGRLKLSFHDEIQRSFKKKNDTEPFLMLEFSLYSENVKRYLDIFGSKQVKIIIFEQWIKDSRHTLEEILNFLDLNYQIHEFEKEDQNPYVVPRGRLGKHILASPLIRKISQKTILPSKRMSLRKLIVKKQPKPTIDVNDKNTLMKFYNDDVKKLEKILGKKLPWKNFDLE